MSPQYPRVQRKGVGSALTAGAGSSTGNSLVETFQSASPYTHRTRDGVREWVGRRRRADCQALAAGAGSSSGNSLIDDSVSPPAVTASRAGASSVTGLRAGASSVTGLRPG